MSSIATATNAMPLVGSATTYGDTVESKSLVSLSTSATWDAHVIHGCVCSSSWKVGLGAGETQLPEYFGPDCSLRRCPSGDNPFTLSDETDCHKKSQTGVGRGSTNNICHIDCSNQGVCDYTTGQCQCFKGLTGLNCGTVASPDNFFK